MSNPSKYNPKVHHRRSIRLKDYDYSQEGAYYVTICVRHKLCLFGDVVNDEMILNDAGKMVDKWWLKVPEKFPDIELDVYQVMPNHFHAIIVNTGSCRGRPMCLPHSRRTEDAGQDTAIDEISSAHTGSPLYQVIQWFKTMCTNEYIRNVKSNNWDPFNGKLYQRNYWEHIIRNGDSYNKIAAYIMNNPAKWADDVLYNRK